MKNDIIKDNWGSLKGVMSHKVQNRLDRWKFTDFSQTITRERLEHLNSLDILPETSVLSLTDFANLVDVKTRRDLLTLNGTLQHSGMEDVTITAEIFRRFANDIKIVLDARLGKLKSAPDVVSRLFESGREYKPAL